MYGRRRRGFVTRIHAERFQKYLCRYLLGWPEDGPEVTHAGIARGRRGWKDGQALDQGTGLAPRTVRETLKRLQERGILRSEPQRAWNGARTANRYTLNLDWTPPQGEGGGAGSRGEGSKASSPSGAVAPPPSPPAGAPPPGAAAPLFPYKHTGENSGKETTTTNREEVVVDGPPADTALPSFQAAVAVVVELIEQGIAPPCAGALVRECGVERCRAQLRYLPYRPEPPRGTRAGQLRRAIEENWTPPEGCLDQQCSDGSSPSTRT